MVRRQLLYRDVEPFFQRIEGDVSFITTLSTRRRVIIRTQVD